MNTETPVMETPLDAHGIEIVSDLVLAAAAPEIIHIDTKGLGHGLPETVPVGWNGRRHEFVSLQRAIEEYRFAPQRVTGTARVDTLRSFIDLVNRHKDWQSALFGKTLWPNPQLLAVIDYHSAASDPRFGRHRVLYEFPVTEEFDIWTKFDGKPMEQDEFAAFLEEHSLELAAPEDAERALYEREFRERFATPSELIELSRHLEVHVSSRARQGTRLSSGERVIEFSEEHQNAKGEPVVIPGIFIVSIRVFVDGEKVRIPARLRYRISGGSISWFYQLYRWRDFVREQVEHDMLTAAKETDLPAYQGSPES